LSKNFDCDSVWENLSDFIDEDQREELCQAIREHLSQCPDCRVYVDKVKKTIFLYKGNLKASELSIKTTAKLGAAMKEAYAAEGRPN